MESTVVGILVVIAVLLAALGRVVERWARGLYGFQVRLDWLVALTVLGAAMRVGPKLAGLARRGGASSNQRDIRALGRRAVCYGPGMRAIRELEWRAILAGVGAVLLASIVLAAIPILIIMAVPTPHWFQDFFIWLSDTEGGRVISAFAYLAAGSAVAYRVSSQRRALHGCLVPVVAVGGLWLMAGIGAVLWGIFG